jgi:hypothetical protein
MRRFRLRQPRKNPASVEPITMTHSNCALAYSTPTQATQLRGKEDDPFEQSGVRVSPQYAIGPLGPWVQPSDPALVFHGPCDLLDAIEDDDDDEVTTRLPAMASLNRPAVSALLDEDPTAPLCLTTIAQAARGPAVAKVRARRGTSRRAALSYLVGSTLLLALSIGLTSLPPTLGEDPQYAAQEVEVDLSWTEARLATSWRAGLDPAFGVLSFDPVKRAEEPVVLAWADLPLVLDALGL